MKRIAHMLLLSVLCLCLLSGAVTAGAESWELDEVGVTVELPDNMVAFTRDLDSHDPGLIILGFSRGEQLDYMYENDYYLCAYDEDLTYELSLSVTRGNPNDIRLLDDEARQQAAELLKNDLLADGLDVTCAQVYPHSQVPFFKHSMSYADEYGTQYLLQYFTVCDDREIALFLVTYDTPFTDEMYAMMDDVVDSLHFDVLEPARMSPLLLLDNPWLKLVFDLLFTVAVYSMPIAAYRYGVRRAPMEPKAARKVVVIYGIVSFVIMCVLLYLLTGSGVAGASILLWGYVNYAMLTHGKKPDGDDFPAPPAESPPWEG